MSERSWLPYQFKDPKKPAGCMVGLWLTPDAAAALAVEGGAAPESLHLTLCMLEQSADALDDIMLARLLTVVDDLAAWTAPLDGEIAGLGRFYASDSSDGKDVIFAIPSIPDLVELRQRIVTDLGYRGLTVKTTFGFAPHITLVYVAPGAESPVAAVPTIPLRFDALTVCVGDRMTTVPLRGYRDGALCYTELTTLASNAPTNNIRLFYECDFAEVPATIPIMPKPGIYAHPTYGAISITEDRIANFVANHNARVYQQQVPISIDAEHELKMYGALGYLGDMFVEPDGSASCNVGLWTDRAKELIADDAFKYVSPEWWDVWTDGATGTEYADVVTGVAVCTKPYFKDDSLRPLVASARNQGEQSLSMTFNDKPVRFVAAEEAGTPPEVNPMSDKTPTAQQFSDLQKSFGELKGEVVTLTEKLTASETARAAAETKAAETEKLAAENATKVAQLEQDKQHQEFTDEVMGRTKDSKIRWFGDLDAHVATLETQTPEQRERYIAAQRQLAVQISTSPILMSARGSDAPGADQSAFEEVEAKAQKYRDEHPELSMAQAITAVTEADPKLSRRYREEKRAAN